MRDCSADRGWRPPGTGNVIARFASHRELGGKQPPDERTGEKQRLLQPIDPAPAMHEIERAVGEFKGEARWRGFRLPRQDGCRFAS